MFPLRFDFELNISLHLSIHPPLSASFHPSILPPSLCPSSVRLPSSFLRSRRRVSPSSRRIPLLSCQVNLNRFPFQTFLHNWIRARRLHSASCFPLYLLVPFVHSRSVFSPRFSVQSSGEIVSIHAFHLMKMN